jgi:hypothetical protein
LSGFQQEMECCDGRDAHRSECGVARLRSQVTETLFKQNLLLVLRHGSSKWVWKFIYG